ncbi:uncharacterized protein LOC141912447 [Tubulanus polymorphus]|uniref:uncharacterized protein LOC141912447 n=1 Tax=Tubulanus polymorphus TaxID=672921 RepID=UPI003DA34D53
MKLVHYLAVFVVLISVWTGTNAADIDVVILLDSSSSMYSSEFPGALTLTRKIAERLLMDAAINVAVAVYSSQIKVIQWLDGDRTKLVTSLNMKYDGTAAHTGSALDYTRINVFSKGARNKAQKVLIIIGSGESKNVMGDVEETRIQLEKLYSEAVRVYSLSYDTPSNVIHSSVSRSNRLYLPYAITTAFANRLVSYFISDIVKDVNCPYGQVSQKGRCVDLDECDDANPCTNGGTCRNVALSGYTCTCTAGMIGDVDCEVQAEVDVAVIIDVSHGVYSGEWSRLFEGAKQLLSHFYLDPARAQVAVGSVAKNFRRGTDLNTCYSLNCLMSVTEGWRWTGEIANTYLGFEFAKKELLVKNGARGSASKAVVYIGSGLTTDRWRTSEAIHKLLTHGVRVYSLLTMSYTVLHNLPNHFLENIRIADDFTEMQTKSQDLLKKLIADASCDMGKVKTAGKCKDVDECVSTKHICPRKDQKCVDTKAAYQCPCSSTVQACKEYIELDLVIMLDKSNKMKSATYKLYYVILSNLLRRFKITPDYARVALVVYGKTPLVEKNLNDCVDADCLGKSILNRNWAHENSAANLGLAFDVVREKILLSVDRRKGVPLNILYLGSGVADDNERLLLELEHIGRLGHKIHCVSPTSSNSLADRLPSVQRLKLSSALKISVPVHAIARFVAKGAICDHGYTESTPGKCVDIDECKAILKPCFYAEGQCHNMVVGGFRCICPQVPKKVCLERTKLNVAIYLDKSSAAAGKFSQYLNLYKAIIRHLAVHIDFVQVSANYLDDTVSKVTDSCNSSYCIVDSLNKLKLTASGKRPDTWKAFEHARNTVFTGAFQRSSVDNIVIYVGPGHSSDLSKTVHSIHRLNLDNVRVYALGDGTAKDVVSATLPTIYGPKFIAAGGYNLGTSTHTATQLDALAYALTNQVFANTAASSYYKYIDTNNDAELDVNECSAKSPCVNGGTCLNRDPGFICPCRKSKVPNCKEMTKLEIAMILDCSEYIYADEFDQLKKFFKAILNRFYVHPDFVRVSLASVEATTTVHTTLDQCKNLKCLTAVVDGWGRSKSRWVDTHTALKKARSEMLVKGARKLSDTNIKSNSVVVYVGSGVASERSLTLQALQAIWDDDVRFYGLFYDIEENVFRKVVPEKYRDFIPYNMPDSFLTTLPQVLAHRITDDDICPYGEFLNPITSTCSDVDECQKNNPCFTGGTCSNQAGDYLCA